MAKIKEIGKVVTGKTPSTKNEVYWNENVPFITPTDLLGTAEVKNTERYISKEGLESIKNNSISGVSILVGCIGSDMGNVAYTMQTCATNQQINAITDVVKTVNPFFIYYYLSNKKAIFQQLAGKTTTPILSKSDFEEIEIPIPNKEEQDRIVSILSEIDAKIDNNNAIAAELEGMAKELYNYWFVQFDFPDENGKPYKSSGGKMVWNEELKREIPAGWEVGNLYSIAEPINGLACQKYRPAKGKDSLPVVKIKEMHTGITAETERASSNIPPKNRISSGDILFSWSATLEVMFWFGCDAALNQHIFKVVPANGYTKEYVYHQYSAYVINFVKMADARKTTMGHITTDHLEQSKIVLPPINIVHQFSLASGPLYKKIENCQQESAELASLRDFLLPMLMNGQVKVKGA